MKEKIFVALFLVFLILNHAHGQEGIKVNVSEKCIGCHRESNGYVSRISYIRKTPEGWEETLWRHKRTHGVNITNEEKEAILSSLSFTSGLAPSEVVPFSYTLEKVDTKEKVDNQSIVDTCVRCHSYAKTALQRRTHEEWNKLANMHSGVLPLWLYQCQDVIDWDGTLKNSIENLSKMFPLITKDYEEWIKVRKEFQQGLWGIKGFEPGKGEYFGIISINVNQRDKVSYKGWVEYLETGEKVELKGHGKLYGGYAWRTEGTFGSKKIKEVLHLADNSGNTLIGRRFDAVNNELGGKETRVFIGDKKEILGVFPSALKIGSKEKIKIYGINLPKIKEKDLKFSEKQIKVDRVEMSGSNVAEVILNIDDKANQGKVSLEVGGKEIVLNLYKSVDYIKISPEIGISRTGGIGDVVKQYTQYDCFAYSNGPDGIRGTEDDIKIGRVMAQWRIEELPNKNDDDDKNYVGEITQNGLFIPNIQGPNKRRPMSENNIGDIWVYATYNGMEARAYHLATIPLYVKRPVQ